MEFLEPWFGNSDSRLTEELRREMAPGHTLKNLDLNILANRHDCDEFLYLINDGSGRLAAVHLTWSKNRESIPTYPHTRIFSPELWLEYMEAAHAEWVGAKDDPNGQLWFKQQQLWDSAQKDE